MSDSGVPDGALLVAFVEAALGNDPEKLAAARQSLRDSLGQAALVDTAAAVASFNAVVKVADGVGLQLEDAKATRTTALRDQLGINAFEGD